MGDVFIACKRGDLSRVKTLVEEMQCDINVTDKWNSTPLYYACLSGYNEIVYYLLQSGATYNLDRLSGERCMNGALTDEIRNMLRNPPQRKTFQRNLFREAMALMLNEAYSLYSDVCLVVGRNQRLYAHKVVLCKHSTYFEHSLHGPNRGKYFIYFRHYKEGCVAAWLEILKYMYTQRLDLQKQENIYKDCLHLSRRLGLQQLTSQLRAVLPKLYKKGTEEVPVELECSYYPEIAEIAISDMNSEGRKERQHFADLCICVQKRRFYCHKAFVVSHSPYFAALLDTNQFTEVTRSTRGKLTFITLSNIDASTFALILKFIYTGRTDISSETLHDLLYYSDHYMIHGLKLGCGELLNSQLDLTNAVQTLALARMIRMTKLQHAALRFIAYKFEHIRDKSELCSVLVQDESCLRSKRLVRVSESSLDEEEEEEEEEATGNIQDTCVDVQMDLRLYLREITNKQEHSHQAQIREESCVRAINDMLAGE